MKILIKQTEKTAGFLVQALNTKNFLWTRRSATVNNPNEWTPVIGGHAESNETYLQAAKREFQEETGYKNKLNGIKRLGKVKTKKGFYTFFYATVPQEFNIDLSDPSIRKEVRDFKWAPLNSNLKPKHQRFKQQQKSLISKIFA